MWDLNDNDQRGGLKVSKVRLYTVGLGYGPCSATCQIGQS